MLELFQSAAYMPHGYCLFWSPWLIGLHAFADLLIVTSYFAIPFALFSVLRQRRDIRFGGLVSLFASFILLCGITHLLGIVTLWYPIYPLEGIVKLGTGVVSATTAIILYRLVPTLVTIPSPSQLQEANDRLTEEVMAHRATTIELRAARDHLELQVAERTAELTDANRRLGVAAREAVHRGRNILSIASSIARQTAQASPDMQTFIEGYQGRLSALSRATAGVLNHEHRSRVRVSEVIDEVLEPSILTFGDRIERCGPDLPIVPEAAQQIGLALHELATNATKSGALSGDAGHVRITWRQDDAADRFFLRWTETAGDGTEAVERHPQGNGRPEGFGTTLLMRVVPTMLEGEAWREFTPDGMVWEVSAPMGSIRREPTEIEDDIAAVFRRTDRVYGRDRPS